MKSYITEDAAREYQKLFRQKTFRLKDTGTSSRVFNSWKNQELMPDSGKEYTGRTELNFSEYIWIKIIQDMRKFGCPLEFIKAAKGALFSHSFSKMEADVQKKGLNNMLQPYFEMLEAKGAILNPDRNHLFESIEKKIKEKRIYDVITEELYQPLNNLEYYIVILLTEKSDAYLMFQNGTSAKYEETKHRTFGLEFTQDSFLRTSPEYPHIKISLRHYIKGFIADQSKESQLEAVKILSDEELKLLKLLRKGNATEISVKLQDGKIDRIEVTENLKTDAEKRIIETFTSHEYADITYKVADGKVVSFKKTEKFKPVKN